MFKQVIQSLLALVFIAALGVAISTPDTGSAGSSVPAKESFNITSATDFTLVGDILLIRTSQASKFNHSNQTIVEYVFVALIGVLTSLVGAAAFRLLSPHIPVPWFISKRHASRFRLGGWKEGNFQFKAQPASIH